MPVELGVEDVVHHAARVADLKAARLDAADRGRPDDVDLLLLGDVDEVPRHVLGDPLSDDGDRPNTVAIQWEILKNNFCFQAIF